MGLVVGLVDDFEEGEALLVVDSKLTTVVADIC